jgi:hypothetical protein
MAKYHIKIIYTFVILFSLYYKLHIPEETDMFKIYISANQQNLKHKCYTYFVNNIELLSDKNLYPHLYNRMVNRCNIFKKDIDNEKIRIDTIKIKNLCKTVFIYFLHAVYLFI